MTQQDMIRLFPQKEGESQAGYSRRLKKIAEEKGMNWSSEAIRSALKRMIKTEKKLDKNGKEISSTFKLQSDSPEIPENFVPKKYTKTHTNQHWITYEQDKEGIFKLNKDIIAETLKDIELKPLKTPVNRNNGKILHLTYTDTHIGMDTDADNTAMYPTEWNQAAVMETISHFIDKVDRHLNGHDAIHVKDLGDLLDGYNSQTTRGGHHLPQNMSNQEAFVLASKFKIALAKELSKFNIPIYFHSVVNDNHSGDFAELLNFHVKEVLKYMMPHNKYYVQRKFIEHYNYGVHHFVLSHGKDKKHCIKGLSPSLDARSNSIVEGYFKHKKLSNNITFEKGDSHIFINDKSKYYNYISHGAVSPASEWIQTNFQKSKRLFSITEVYKNEPEINPICYEIR